MKTYGDERGEFRNVFASQTKKKAYFGSFVKNKKKQRNHKDVSNVLLFHVHSLDSVFLYFRSPYPEIAFQSRRSMTGIGHLIRKETDLLSILTRTHDETLRKEFDDH